MPSRPEALRTLVLRTLGTKLHGNDNGISIQALKSTCGKRSSLVVDFLAKSLNAGFWKNAPFGLFSPVASSGDLLGGASVFHGLVGRSDRKFGERCGGGCEDDDPVDEASSRGGGEGRFGSGGASRGIGSEGGEKGKSMPRPVGPTARVNGGKAGAGGSGASGASWTGFTTSGGGIGDEGRATLRGVRPSDFKLDVRGVRGVAGAWGRGSDGGAPSGEAIKRGDRQL